MTMPRDISFEHLNAFVDDQLDKEEKELVFQAVKEDEALGQEACALRSLQDMVRHAYQDPPAYQASRPAGGGGRRRWLAALAAGLFLLAGAGLGWLAHTQLKGDGPVVLRIAGRGVDPTAVPGVILHLNSNDPHKIDATLRKTEELLERFGREHHKVRVEVIVNSKGLDLLRVDTSPAADRIRALVRRYHNVSFLACQRAIQRLKYEQGVEAKLLAEARVAPSALGQILSRLQQGWTYIQI